MRLMGNMDQATNRQATDAGSEGLTSPGFIDRLNDMGVDFEVSVERVPAKDPERIVENKDLSDEFNRLMKQEYSVEKIIG